MKYPTYEMDLIGKQLLLALRYAEHGFPSDEHFDCEVSGERLRGGNLFVEKKNRHFLRFDSIPGALSIKAIGVTEKKLLLETAELDLSAFRTAIQNFGLSYPLMIESTGIVAKGQSLISLRWNKKVTKRCLWTFQWPKFKADDRRLAITLMDLAYASDTFVQSDDNSFSPQVIEKLTLDLDLSLRQELELEQVPEMAIQPEMSLAQMFIMEQRILRMTAEELAEFALKDDSVDGKKRKLNILIFALARKVKQTLSPTQPDLSWREARRIVRETINRGIRKKN